MRRRVLQSEVSRFLDAWFALRQFIQAANFNRFQGTGLSATQFMTLNLLPPGGEGLAMGELARRMNLKPATVAKTVDSLEARRLVTRLRNGADKRIVLVTVTDEGRELQNAAQGQFQTQIQQLFRAMLPEERDALILGLESITRVAGRADRAGSAGGVGARLEKPRGGRGPGRVKTQPGLRARAAATVTPRAGVAPAGLRSGRQSRRPKS